jgi:hypothetical protein
LDIAAPVGYCLDVVWILLQMQTLWAWRSEQALFQAATARVALATDVLSAQH